MRLLVVATLLSACQPDIAVSKVPIDADNDGYDTEVDCDDARNDVNPTAPELCDERDNDCDGEIDEEATDAATFYADADGDGFGDAATPIPACAAPAGATGDATDCDDALATIHPGADEFCNGLDDDCDAESDEQAVDAETAYADLDDDGHGDPNASVTLCELPFDHVSDATDCDDTDATIHPDATENCWNGVDDDCDGDDDCALTTADADCTFVGEDAGDLLGSRVATADLDGDGVSDVILSAYENDRGGAGAGAAYVFFGSTLACGGAIDVSTADWILTGEAAGDALGAVSSPGDVDGDGRDELWVGSPYHDGYAGTSYLFLGSSLTAAGGIASVATADYTFSGVSGDSYSAPAPIGDVDGDGLADLMFSSVAAASWTGRVYLWPAASLTAPGAYRLGDAPIQLTGPAVDRVCGFDGNGNPAVGDLDGDGRDDLVVGCKGYDSTATGTAYVVYGADLPTEGELDLAAVASHCVEGAASERIGFSVSAAGDLDGDGAPDLLVGGQNAAEGAGVAYALLAADLAGSACVEASSLAFATFRGNAPADYLGRDGNGLGDIDGDGLGDLLLGAFGDDGAAEGAGAAWFVLGRELAGATYDLRDATVTIGGGAAGDGFGTSLRGGGDFDGDGLADVIVGAHGADTSAAEGGAAYLFFGE